MKPSKYDLAKFDQMVADRTASNGTFEVSVKAVVRIEGVNVSLESCDLTPAVRESGEVLPESVQRTIIQMITLKLSE